MNRVLLLLISLLLIACGAENKSSSQNIVNWRLDKLCIYDNDSINSELKHVLLQSTVVFNNDTIIINGKHKAKFIHEKGATNKYFVGSDIIKDFYIDIFRAKGVDISDSVNYIRLVDYDYNPNEFSFDSFSLWQTIICTDEYLCLPYKKFKALLFENSDAIHTLAYSQLGSGEDRAISSKNTLPFNLNDFMRWQGALDSEIPDEYTDNLSYSLIDIDDSPHLKKSYLEKWHNDTIPLGVFEFDRRKNFELYVYVCTLNNDTPAWIAKIVTMRNGEIIDGLTAHAFIAEDDGGNNSFIISEDLRITFLNYVFGERRKIRSSTVLKEFQIDVNGNITKL